MTAIFQHLARTGMPRWLLLSDRQDAYIVRDRAVAAIVAHDYMGMTWTSIGQELKRSRTSVMRLAQSHGGDSSVIEAVGEACKSLNIQLAICTEAA
jgi:hypothetical protein